MKATDWEFKYRALVFGLIFAFAFQMYAVDRQNATAVLATWMGADIHLLFGFAALLVLVAAFVRTWASSYLHAGVVYAAELKSAALVADGPYRQVRNPLYFANVLLAAGMGAMASRTGFVVAVVLMLVFCYRLILREESELQASQGQQYEAYRRAVPRLWPSLQPRVASSGQRAQWIEGFKAESWYWGFAVALVAFALTLNTRLALVILGASMVLFWVSSTVLRKKSAPL